VLRPHSFSTFLASASPALRVGLALALFFTLSGCYSYVAMVGEDPGPGDEVRLRLSAVAAEDLSNQVGRPVRSVEGHFIGLTSDSLRVDVGWGALYAGTVFEGRRDTLQFHRAQLLEVDRKEFSRTRTGILVGALAAVAVVAFRSISAGGRGRDTGNGEPTPF
jgi:hypothetical protein